MQITPADIAETLAMVGQQHLDIRTITMGISLRGCVDDDIDRLAAKVYERMTTAADVPYGTGALKSKYRGQDGPTPSQYWKNFEA